MTINIGSANISKVRLAESSSPSTPASGFGYLYAKTTGLYFKGDDGVEIGPLAAGLQKGTAFPDSPATGDFYFRTDRNLQYFYDGTRWLTANEYSVPVATQDVLTGVTNSPQTSGYTALDNGTYNVYLTRIVVVTTVITTNDGTKYWTITAARQPSATSLGSFTTASDSASTATRHVLTVNALSGTTDIYINVTATKTSTPGALYVMPTLYYRLVG